MEALGPTSTVPDDARGAAIALGNFDGVHRGHQAVIASARDAAADARGVALGAAVFEPHPRRFFQPDAPPFRLQSTRQRARALGERRRAGSVRDRLRRGAGAIDATASSPSACCAICLARAHVSVGADFRFGKGRMGDAASLAALGAGVRLQRRRGRARDGRRREDLLDRDPRRHRRAATWTRPPRCSTRPWAIEGEVLRGFQRGARLRLSDGESCARRLCAPAAWRLRRARRSGRRRAVARRGERRREPDGRRAARAGARGAPVRFQRRSLRQDHRGRARSRSCATKRSSTTSKR